MMTDEQLRESWTYAYRAALKTQQHRDVGEAEDAAQEAMLRLLQGRANGKDTAKPGWFGSVAHNYVLSQRRRKLTRHRHDRILVGSQTVEPEHLTKEREEADAALLAFVLSRTPERYRTVIQAVCVEGKSYVEVAELLLIPVGTVMSRIFRARQILRSVLKKVRCG